MRVIFFDVSGKGGITHHIFFMCNALAEMGIHVLVITTKDNEMDLSNAKFSYKKLLNSHHHKKTDRAKGKTYLCSLIRFVYCVFHEKPDIIHWHEIKIPFLEYHIITFFQRRHIRVVLSAHDVLNQESKIVTKSMKKLYSRFDHIITHAEYSKRLIINLFGVNSENVDVIPIGEYSQIVGDLKNKPTARRKFGIHPDRKVLLFFGYIRKYKGLDLLIKALSIVRQSIPDVFLIIAGEPKEDFSIYERDIEDRKLSDIVYTDIRYIPIENISDYFLASDVVIIPYRSIYQSGLLYLAFAHQRPVIATNVGGLPEVIDNEKNGYIIPPNDENELSFAIERALSDIPRLEKMGHYAYRNTKEKNSWHRIAEKTTRIYHNIIKD